MTIDIYSMRLSPPCRAVLMTAKQLGIELNEKKTDLSEDEHLKPEYLKLNPAHTIPTIDDNGFVLWESRAIMQYLCNKYAPDSSLYPKDPKKRAIVDRWLNFDTTLMAQQREAVFTKMFLGIEPPADKVETFKNSLKLADQLIGDNKYLTGNELTIADLSLLACVALLDTSGAVDLSQFPNFQRWLSARKADLPYFDEINNFSMEEVMAYVEKMKPKILARMGLNK